MARSRNVSQLARETGLTREGLYKALSDIGNPSFGTVLKVVHAMGYRLTVSRKQAKARPIPAKRVAKRVVVRKSVAKRASRNASIGKTARDQSRA